MPSDSNSPQPPRRKGRPLLLAAGAVTISFLGCGPPFVTGNLLPPPPCDEASTDPTCTPDAGDAGTSDGGVPDGGQ